MIVHLDIDFEKAPSSLQTSTLTAIRAYARGLRAEGYAVNLVVEVNEDEAKAPRKKVKHDRRRNRR